MAKNLPAMQKTWVKIPGLGRSPGEGKGNPLQYSFLENPMDKGAWQAIIQGVAKSRTQLSETKCTRTHTHTHTQNMLKYA